jgi:hypothetical protein|nr:MAG TPA: tail completion protein [Caudoviricetes sp.]
MGRRVELQKLLEEISNGAPVYFQAPNYVLKTVPTIVYELEDRNTRHADNIPYRHIKLYSVTVIYRNPDDPLPDKIANIPGCTTDRMFVTEGLYHQVFRLYY